MKKQKTWLITGASSGLGEAIAHAALHEGDIVVGTFRSEEQAVSFRKKNGENAFGVCLDLSDEKSMELGFNKVLEYTTTIDILVNNAGYGMAGAVEETSMRESRDIFDVNFFGVLKITKAALPLMRKQTQGHIIQISSHGGIKAFAGFGIYNASKFALEGMSEALAQELQPLGIHLTLVEPGPLRTRFAGKSFLQAAQRIEDYKPTAGAFRDRMALVNGKQEGDPEKAALEIVHLTRMKNPPLRLPLGKIALVNIGKKIEELQLSLNESRATAERVVF